MSEQSPYTGVKIPSDEEFLHCIRCGLCLYTCPTYRTTLVESDSPRGRIALVRAAAEGVLNPGPNFADKFYRCLLCGSCSQVCPSGVEVSDLLLAARTDAAQRGLLPENLVLLDGNIITHYNISAEDNAQRLLWSQNLEKPPQGTDKQQAEVVYFVGCVSSFFPRSYRLPQSFTRILEAAGVDYALLGEEEWCCGYPLLINGELEKGRELIRHNVERARALGAKRVVTTCPSCYHTWKHTYPEVLGHELDVEVLHATELMAELLEEGRLSLQEFNETVTYHDPCDLGRKSGVYDAPRQVLRAIPGLKLVEMADNRENSHCCGGGGNLETYRPELAQAVARRRLGQALDTEARYIVSACQQCERTLTAAARREKVRIRVMDITELVARLMVE